jgi:hypothetical protein
MSAFTPLLRCNQTRVVNLDAMKLFELGDGGMASTPPSLFAYRQEPVGLTLSR